MTHEWIGFTADDSRDDLERALREVNPMGHLVFAKDAADIRRRFRDGDPGKVGAIVGLSHEGVSDVNLAAAIASDHRAREVVLVSRFVTESLRARAAEANISRVIDVDDLIFDELLADERPQEAREITNLTEETTRKAPVIVFASGRGGVGKSALSAMVAALAGQWGMRVALCDLDFACGNLPSFFGVGTWRDLTTCVIKGALDKDEIASSGVSAAEGVTLWGPCERPELAERAMPYAGGLLTVLRDNADLVVVDTSSTCTDAVAQAMQMADRLVLVHDESPSAISYLARTSALAVRLGVARTRIVRVENGCAPRLVNTPFPPLAEMGLESARAYRVPDGGDELRDLLAAGNASELVELGGESVRGVAAMLASQLSEMGCLPDDERARHAIGERRSRRGRGRRARRREVA